MPAKRKAFIVVSLGDRTGEGFDETTLPPLVALINSASPDYCEVPTPQGAPPFSSRPLLPRKEQIGWSLQQSRFAVPIRFSGVLGLALAMKTWLQTLVGLAVFGRHLCGRCE
jgi:hypothetical protein